MKYFWRFKNIADDLFLIPPSGWVERVMELKKTPDGMYRLPGKRIVTAEWLKGEVWKSKKGD
jgi:hypothetical protein